MLHSLLLWSSHCLLHELAVLRSSSLLFPSSVAVARCGAGDLKLSGPLPGQVKMLLEENAALQVILISERKQNKTQETVPFSVNLMGSQVLYQAAQWVSSLTKKLIFQQKQGTTPFGVNVMRSQVLYQAAQGVSSDICMLSTWPPL